MMLDLVSVLGGFDGPVALASAGGDGDIRYLGLLLLLSGFVFYGLVYLRYRNTDKRHRHESETEAKMLDVRGSDVHVNTLTGVSESSMRGANNRQVRGAKRGLLEAVESGGVKDVLGVLRQQD